MSQAHWGGKSRSRTKLWGACRKPILLQTEYGSQRFKHFKAMTTNCRFYGSRQTKLHCRHVGTTEKCRHESCARAGVGGRQRETSLQKRCVGMACLDLTQNSGVLAGSHFCWRHEAPGPLAVSVSHIQANDHLVQVMWLKAKQNCIAGTEALQTHVETNHAPEQGLEEDNKNQACRYICGRLADMSQAGWRDKLRPHTQNLQNREFFRSSLIMQVGACSWHNQLGALATPDVR